MRAGPIGIVDQIAGFLIEANAVHFIPGLASAEESVLLQDSLGDLAEDCLRQINRVVGRAEVRHHIGIALQLRTEAEDVLALSAQQLILAEAAIEPVTSCSPVENVDCLVSDETVIAVAAEEVLDVAKSVPALSAGLLLLRDPQVHFGGLSVGQRVDPAAPRR